jgi:outer membrane protein assembly factor BamB
VLEAHPGNAATQALYEGLENAVEATRREAMLALNEVRPAALPFPPRDHRVLQAITTVRRGPVPALGGMRMTPNKIVDDEAWFEKHGLALPRIGRPEAARGIVVPQVVAGRRLSQVIDHGDHFVLVHGDRVVTVVDRDGAVIGIYDLTDFTGLGGMSQDVRWAQARDGVLYVSNGNLGYARSAGGHNAYLTAIDLATGDIRWRSEPLVANSTNFLIHGGYLLSGYGFTAESDFLYVIARDSGETVKRVALPTKPDVLLAKDGKLFVRGYDKDFVFDLPAASGPPPGSVAGRSRPTGATLSSAAFARPLEPTAQDRCLRDNAILHLDHAKGPGEPIDEAASSLWRLSRSFKQTEAVAALRKLVGEVQAGRRWLLQGPVHRAAKPPSKHTNGPVPHPALPAGDPPRLVQRTKRKNAITDRRQWLIQHGARFPQRPRTAEDAQRQVGGFAVPGAPVPQVPLRFGLHELDRVLDHGDHYALIYGGRFLVIVREGVHLTSLDLGLFVEPAAVRDTEWAQFATQEVTWAEHADGVIYVCNGGGSYAKEVYGKKGYVSAVDERGGLIWRSDPLVCNANFVLRGRHLITGYGFTAEPDNVFVIDRATGETVSRTPVTSAPEIFVLEGDALHLRTYDTDYVFDLK